MNPPPLHYARATTAAGPQWRVSAFVMPVISAVLVLLVLDIALLFVVPFYEEVFRDFRIGLPPITVFLIRVSHWYANIFAWLFIHPLILFAFVAVRLILGPQPTRAQRRLMTYLTTLLIGMIVATMVYGMLTPMMTLYQGITAPQGGK